MKSGCASFFLSLSALLPILILSAASAAVFARPGIDSIVTRPGGTILFNRYCANEEYYQVHAYAILESHDSAARALMQISTGYFRLENSAVQIGFDPLEFDFDLGPEWADSELSMQIMATTGEQEFVTLAFAAYLDSEFGREPIRRPFITDARGRLNWRNFVEPELVETKADQGSNVAEYAYFDASELVINNSGETIWFSLRLTRDRSDAEILLTGPAFRIPNGIWNMDLSEPRVLGLLQSLNPFQKGGMIDALNRGMRYRDCLQERKEARLQFHN